ncbi:MAG: type II toxin-antitoxin system prevent-host-death family antitoxin [Thermoleophilia bacterium]|jgi:prevent-host-death family protein|nr:type II toxin-antitoxin system prevent-host-death family antitoxin [Thermoleophilia bacterium]
MISIGVRELRQNASRYLRLVEGGETVRVTDRGRPVALMVPVPEETGDRLERLYREGKAKRPTVDWKTLPPPMPLPPGATPPSVILARMREHER